MNANSTPIWPESEAGQRVKSRFESEATLNGIDHLLERIQTLEKAVDRLSDLMEQGPGLLSIAADSIDEVFTRAKKQQINLEERLGNALQLAERLTAPEMVEKLEGIFTLSNQMPGLLSMGGDVIDETYRKAAQNGIDIEQRLSAALKIAEQLTRPELVAKLGQLIETTEQLPGLVSMATDVIDEQIKNARSHGIDVEQRVGNALSITEKLTSPAITAQVDQAVLLSEQLPGLIAMLLDIIDEWMRKSSIKDLDINTLAAEGTDALQQLAQIMKSDGYQKLKKQGILNESYIDLLGQTLQAVEEAQQVPTSRVSVWGVMRSLKDPDRQKAVSFLLNVAKQFGQKL